MLYTHIITKMFQPHKYDSTYKKPSLTIYWMKYKMCKYFCGDYNSKYKIS